MNIIQIFKRFPTQKSCVKHLEKARWGKIPYCPYCGSENTYPMPKELRHHCNSCRKSFRVTVGTIFHHTHLPLQKWFLAIALILNAKKGISSRQLARDLELPVKTAWSVSMRIRNAMSGDGALLRGIVEMDETYVGGKPRKGKDDDEPRKRGRGTKKTPVVGMIERGGNVKATSFSKSSLKFENLQNLVRENIDVDNTTLITDEFKSYLRMSHIINHRIINHQITFSDGDIHTNNIESFWSVLKRGIIGQFHKVSVKYLPQYIDEFCFRFNLRFSDSDYMFDSTINRMLFV